MKNNDVLVICHLTDSKCNGQVAKTSDVISFLRKNKYNVTILNYGKMNAFQKLFSSKRIIKKFKNVVLMPGGKNALFFYSSLITKLKIKNSHYVAIGGWVQKLLDDKRINRLKGFKCIYLQNMQTIYSFKEKGFDNLCLVSSFSSKKFLNKKEVEDKMSLYNNIKEYRFCFFARVEVSKGVLLACNAIRQLKQKNPDLNISLDIYGECKNNELKNELSAIESSNNFISYKGVISGNDAIKTLSNYYCMLFPTFYHGEGVPHTIIESFGASLPVIASNWAYNAEIIENGKTGLIFSLKEKDDLENKISWAINHVAEIKEISKNCYLESNKYNIDKLLKPLLKNLEN